MKKLLLSLPLILLALFATHSALAQPANDNFVNAWVLTGTPALTNGNSSNATKETGEPNHAGRPGGRSVWFYWTSPASGDVEINTLGSSFNTLLGVYTGTAVNALTAVASNDNTPTNNQSAVQFAAVQGTTYRIAVDGRSSFGGGASSGAYILRILSLASVTITSPANNSVVAVGASVPINATASIGTTILRVDFYRGGSLIGTDATAPYTYADTGAVLGTNVYTAVAVGSSLSVTSAAVRIFVMQPGVLITSPVDGAYFTSTNPITVNAAAVLASGLMTNIEFHVDGTPFASDATAPFSGVWSAVAAGSHRLTAVGKDNAGNTYSSAAVVFGVYGLVDPTNSVWSYFDQGQEPSPLWASPDYVEEGWGSGPAPLGYDSANAAYWPATTNSFGPDAQNKYITTYYRRSFTLNNPASYSNLVIRLQCDDGVVVYLNGTEVQREGMPTGTIAYDTLATFTSSGTDEIAWYSRTVSPSLLRDGVNVIAAEIHQVNLTSSDIWFDFELAAVPALIRNQPPVVNLTSPTNGAVFLAPASITLDANASDSDGSVRKVEFFVDGAFLGEITNSPYTLVWNVPSIGWHTLTAVATDDQGAATISTGVAVAVYDGTGTPLVQITNPLNNAIIAGPTNLTISANATAPGGVTNVQFLADGLEVGRDASSPYSIVWNNAAFGSNRLTAVAFSGAGARSTSAVVSIFITTPPTNTVPPTIFSVTPVRGAGITGLTNIAVVFSEAVVGVNASDLLVNGVPANSVSGSGSNYVFAVSQPAGVAIAVTWAASHGITDIGWPSALPFDANAVGASWTYTIVDLTPPTITARTPAADAIVSTLSQVSVNFSEPVIGVDAADLLVNGAAAIGLSGSGSNYTFGFAQPANGLVSIAWATGHGIVDLASPPNAFNATGAGATWSYTLDSRTILVQSNANWMFIKGQAEASSPIDAWRFLGFDDSGWSNAAAPFYYGDPYNSATAPGTLLSDMLGGYSSIYLRRTFTLANASAVTNLYLVAQSDDGFIAWINGVEVLRYIMGAGEIPYNGAAPNSINEPDGRGAAYISYILSDPSYLVDGTNVLTVHAFNNQPASSTDFGFNAQLYAFVADPGVVPPRITAVSPPAGDLFQLTNITVTFTEPVTGVDATDLLVNGVPATSVTSTTNSTYTFRFAQPAYGTVSITWAATHGIVDFDEPPKPFDALGTGATFQYQLVNPNAPTVALQSPAAGAIVPNLTQIAVTFSKPVANVDAADLRINGLPASSVTGSSANYTFSFTQPVFGAVSVGWATGHGIVDTEVPANAFDATRPSSSWNYTLVDQAPPVLLSQVPAAGSQVTNLIQISVTFSEAVTGVDASDLLVNGSPATGLSGSGATYTFSFPQPNATTVSLTWAPTHGIRDLATAPNPFNATGPGATWTYTTPDNVAPTVASIEPPAFVTVRSLNQIRVTFTEAVTGVDTNDLIVNAKPAQQVSGSGAGPYTFTFPTVTSGLVEVHWASVHGIRDLAVPPNTFGSGEWSYVVDPNASYAGKVLISEIMYNPLEGGATNEWIELRNISPDPANVTGWRFSKGVGFTFPNASIPAGGYLVVAANVVAFQAQYSGVTNVVGGWTGTLANATETIQLETALGETVNSVHFGAEGDWARRERGHGADVVTITRNGTTAAVSLFANDFTAGDVVMISGADQAQYNGIFTVASPSSAGFSITVSGSPATPATGRIICRQIIDNGTSGWSWFSEADGFGSSLELVNSALPNTQGQNWISSTNLWGTPGRANSVAATNSAPLILDVTHFPVVPASSDSVGITARVQDELTNGVQSVTLFYRDHTANYGANPPAFSSTNMFDDGGHRDGVAGDRIYGAVLPAQAAGNIVEFYVQATDAFGRSRTWPAAAWNTNNTFFQGANALYQVDNESSSTNMPFLRVIMTETERTQLANIDTASDAEMNATFISLGGDGTKVRYTSGIRLRGAGSRGGTPKNYRVNVPSDNPWNNMTELNLNTRFVHSQLAGSALAQKAGLNCADVRVVQVRVNGQNLSSSGTGASGYYVLVQPIGPEWAASQFPLDPDGNVYRASKYPWNANLDYIGTTAASYQGQTGAGYYKTSNRSANDWTDLIRLTYTLSANTPDADYVQAVRTNINVEAWVRYFAVCNFFDYMETSLCRGVGDDYAMYRGAVDPRFRLVAHDFDTVLGQGDTAGSTTKSIWSMIDSPASTDPATFANFLPRFLRHHEFAPEYFRVYKDLLDTAFSPEQLNPLLDQVISPWSTTAGAMKTFANSRRAYLLAQIPLNLTVASSLGSSSGFLYTTTGSATLYGGANIIDTRRVLVNGTDASWLAWQGRWTNTVTLRPGVNRVLIQSLNSNNVEIARATVDVWYDDGTVANASGAIAANTVWTAANGPYQVTGNLTVNSGVTLTIQAGTTVYLSSGVNLTVANGGQLLAEGSDTAPIRFSRAPGDANNWGGITVNGGPASPETRITYANIEGNGSTAIHAADGTLFLDHVTFANPAVQYVSLDRSSFVVQDCVFPATTASFEPAHGTGGIKDGGRGIFLRNYFGPIAGYNDVIDFTGGNRPGPIVQIINNVFTGSGDDILDLDSTDAWVEGNIFLHTHKNGSPDSSSAVSGGADNADLSQVTMIGNLVYDCDQAAMAKQGNFFTLLNNTIVRQTLTGGTDTDSGVVCLADDGTEEGAGFYVEGNIIYDAEKLVRNQTASLVTFTNNLMALTWSGPGGGNSPADPMFAYVPQLSETTNFTSWEQAQVMWNWFTPRTGSPATGAGPNGRDLGGATPRGVSISGEPSGTTPQNTAILRVGVNRTGSGIPSAGFPNGSGYTHYRWRLDGGAWSAETSIASPIVLTDLADSPHFVEVVGRNDAGLYQDAVLLGQDAIVSVSQTWKVDSSIPGLRINELIAANAGAVVTNGSSPDLVELFNNSGDLLNLAGVRLTDDPSSPDKFLFPAGTILPAGGFLVVFANNPDGTPGHHLGFGLNQSGDSLYLYDAKSRGGALLDQVTFGPQITDLSIGRLSDGSWDLTQPTFGAPNRRAPLGNPLRLRINEWLAIGELPFDTDFVELYNSEAVPVALGGLYLSDAILTWPNRHRVADLSFIPAYGYLRFLADGSPNNGADHLNFSLSGNQGEIGLYATNLATIDCVYYQPQRPNISQGRSPNGSVNIVFFDQPTPGAPNPLITTGPAPVTIALVGMTGQWRYNQSGTNLGSAWIPADYNDSAWPLGAGLFAVEDCNCLPYAISTPLSINSASGYVTTYYFRTGFVAPTNGNISALQLSYVLDDGAVFYLNGQEIHRVNLPAGTITFDTQAGAAVGDAGLTGPILLSSGLLQAGTNVLAVEVHQSGTASSDIVFGLSLDALIITNAPPSASLIINEVLASNATLQETNGSTPDWIELYNQSAGIVDLSGLSLTDDTLQPRRWVFPDGTRVAPLDFLRIFCDGGEPASTNSTGFGLKATGGGVYLFDSLASGGSLLSAITYGLQATDLSIGRVPDGSTNWVLTTPTPSSPNAAVPSMGNPATLKVNEWMADPGPGEDDWFEIHNPDPQPVALGNLYLTDDLNARTKHQIAPLSFIGTGTNAWLRFSADGNTGAGADHVSFSLRAAGEAVGISTTNGTLIDGYAFSSQTEGVSEGRFPDGGTDVVGFPGTDSPGESNYRWLSDIRINEALTHTDPPLEDAIELANTTGAPIDIGGWWLSDDKSTLRKYQIPSPTVVPAHGFTVIYEVAFTNRETAAIPFALSSQGDEVVLSAAASGQLTGYRAHRKFDAAENGVSFGDYVNSIGEAEFVAMSRRTFGVDDPGSLQEFRTGTGASNAYPRVGPVVISEIMYHPPDIGTNDNVRDEFIELHNISTAPVPLYLLTNGWRLRKAVSFDFPVGTVLSPGDYLLVVSFNPSNDPTALAAFRTTYHVDVSVPILGPYAGKFANSSDDLELRRPDVPDVDGVPWITVEHVNYADSGFWSPLADGSGFSLQRINEPLYGNDPANWTASSPTPGPQATSLDTDGDGLPDSWEIAHGFDPYNPADAAVDSDSDGLTNLQEYQAGTDPRSPASVLGLEITGALPTLLEFDASDSRSYTVEYSTTLLPGSWQKLLDIPPGAQRRIQVSDPAPVGVRFYRLRTPQTP